ncbi:MAG: CcmD family protein [Acidobacteria bacterium]|nr:MAG: CcmD family protein [Acidobacteriota bacterium]TDI45951.1 MAG: CcmD family protein [Acidobacteriota bacterium]
MPSWAPFSPSSSSMASCWFSAPALPTWKMNSKNCWPLNMKQVKPEAPGQENLVELEKWHNLGYLFWAYMVVWVFLAGYLVLISRRMTRLSREMEILRRERRNGPAS